MGPGLATAAVHVQLMAPALLGGSMYADASSHLDALKTALMSDQLAAGWPSVSPRTFYGSWIVESTAGRDGNQWTASVRVTVGVGEPV